MRTLLVMRASLLLVVMLVVSPMLLVADVEAPPPPNDDFDTATVIPAQLPFTDALDTTLATTADDDPICAGNGHTVWYTFTPSADSTINTNTFFSDYDTTLSVYTGTRGELHQIACNDDADGTPQSSVTFAASGGTKYFIMVASFGEEPGGNLQLTVQEAKPDVAVPAGAGVAPDPPIALSENVTNGTRCISATPIPGATYVAPIGFGVSLTIGTDRVDELKPLKVSPMACAGITQPCVGKMPANVVKCTVQLTYNTNTRQGPRAPQPDFGEWTFLLQLNCDDRMRCPQDFTVVYRVQD